MEFPQGTIDHRENEFFSYRYSTRFQKGDIVDIRTGLDLEAARFQARKSFPDVLNEYWWLKPSDIPALKDLPLKITDIYFYHGGVPVVVLNTANGTLARKAQVFLKKRDEPKHNLDDSVKEEMVKLPPMQAGEFAFNWDGKDYNGNAVGSGQYNVYFAAESPTGAKSTL